jgi:hypothetical protein
LGIWVALTHQRIFRGLARDEAREHRRGLLAHQFGIIVLVELVELHERPGQPRFTADLSGAQRAEQVQDVPRGDPDRIQTARTGHRCQRAIARMALIQVVGDPPSKAIELDPGADHVAVLEFTVQRARQVFRLQHLDLQRHREPVLGTAIAQPDQRLTALDHRPGGQRLQPVEIRASGRIGLPAPVRPEVVNGLAQTRRP